MLNRTIWTANWWRYYLVPIKGGCSSFSRRRGINDCTSSKRIETEETRLKRWLIGSIAGTIVGITLLFCCSLIVGVLNNANITHFENPVIITVIVIILAISTILGLGISLRKKYLRIIAYVLVSIIVLLLIIGFIKILGIPILSIDELIN
jgi:hypothetical protein